MAITPPTATELATIAERYGFHLTPRDVESFLALMTGALASYDAVERLYEARRPDPPSRPCQRPADADNELGAWYVTTEITTRADGPLAGRRVAVKDNIEVAGVPMMNGSAAVEGYTPRRDATVVTRLLDAGAIITGKAVCEDLCFSGGSHTSRTGPGRSASRARSAAPWDTSRPTAWSLIPVRSPSRTPSITSARSPVPCVTRRCCLACWPARTGWPRASRACLPPAITSRN